MQLTKQKFINRLRQVVGLSAKQAEKVFEMMSNDRMLPSREIARTVEVTKEVPVEVLKTVEVIKEVEVIREVPVAVSYTHLTLPTTPYV